MDKVSYYQFLFNPYLLFLGEFEAIAIERRVLEY